MVQKKEKILIVEDEFIVANDLRLTLVRAGYLVCGIASSVEQARKLIEVKNPDWIMLDIQLKGELTGIDLAAELRRQHIPFLYISANTDQVTLERAKATRPYGFLVKPFREKDLFVMLDIARYHYDVEQGRNNTATAANAIGDTLAINGIIGSSPALLEILKGIRIVAPTETSVLILGESGTGKERVAQAIHSLSARSHKPLVTVNCAALPLSLIESELFGHEKGAFTGANQRRIGKFEQAHEGTLFLDEIGELPLEAQVKLLRVLQEKEIERLGGSETVRTDVRIIAATNRNLEQEVAAGKFRLDLYYRLNVFPLDLPPLRERPTDIMALAFFFLERYAAKAKKTVTDISPEVITRLEQYSWPGNIRELEHLIERHVLLVTGHTLSDVNLPQAIQQHTAPTTVFKTMEEMERDHIMTALKACNGRVSGSGGAAEMLHMPATTLYSRMKKLGIQQGYV